MAKKLDRRYRLFIVFVVVWTIVSISLFFYNFPSKNKWESPLALLFLETLTDFQSSMELIKRDNQGKILIESIREVKTNQLKARRYYMYMLPLWWLAPIGLVYVSGWGAGWIIKRFRKDKE